MAMYANKLEERIGKVDVTAGKLYSKNDTVSTIDALATVDSNGKNWSISLINRHPSEYLSCHVKMGNDPLKGKFKATILTAESPESFNDIENPDRAVPREVQIDFIKGITDLPPHSLTIFHVEL